MQYDVVSFFSGPEALDKHDMAFVYEDRYTECDVSTYCAYKLEDALLHGLYVRSTSPTPARRTRASSRACSSLGPVP